MPSGAPFTAPVTAYVALGGNLGDRAALLRAAVARWAQAPHTQVHAASPFYETDAVADEPQPAYLNAVLRLRTALAPLDLLGLALAIERALGRVRPPGRDKAPRTVDCDVLLYGSAVLASPGLTIPHPGLLDRPFVRIPLADVAEPGLAHPANGTPLDVADPDPGVRWFAPPPTT